jgi:uncharacterized membrane protein
MNQLILTSMGMVIVLAACGILAPYLTPRRYYFGMTVAPGFRESENGRAVRRAYNTAILIAAISAVTLMIALPKIAPAASMLPVPLATCIAFFYARSRVQSSSEPITPVREAEISRGPERLPLWTLLALPPIAIPALTAVYLNARWDKIPARFPVHWGLDGQPNRWVERTPHGVFGPLWFNAAIMAVLITLALAGYYGSRRSPMRLAMLKMMVALMYLLGFVFALVGLLPLHHFSLIVFLLPIVVFVAVILMYSYKTSTDPDMTSDETSDSSWRLSSIYDNRADPALFVQKRFGLGYTLNFGNPMSWLIVAMMLALIPAAIFLLR